MTSPWISLPDVDDAARAGNKAVQLAALARDGAGVLPGWVLPVDADATGAGRALLDLDPTPTWILRSSSPREDRPGASAAGVFATVTAAAVPEDLDRAIARVRASADDARARAVVGDDEIPIAVLAQPHRAFDRWCTAERRGDRLTVEGWDFTSGAPVRWTTADPAVRRVALDASTRRGIDPALLEIGVDSEGVWILQVRPAPERALRQTEDVQSDPVGLGAHVAAGDDAIDWIWDHAHSPVPLCPLLATIFGRWIHTQGGAYPSRLIDGRWHDRPGSTDAHFDENDLARWDHAMDAVRDHLAVLDETVERLDGSYAAWSAFVDTWLTGQALYFDAPSGRLRRWVATVEARVGRPLGADPSRSVTTARAARWRELAADPDTEALDAEHRRVGHLCALPYDGRAIPWEEDRAAFERAVARHRDEVRREEVSVDDPDVDRARAVLTRAENDDDLLLQLYLRWRRAAIRTARAIEIPVDDLLDVAVQDLESHLARPDDVRFDDAVTRGRALAAQWAARRPRRVAADATIIEGRAAAPGRVAGPIVRAVHLGEIDSLEHGTIAVVESVLPADAALVPFLAGLVCESGDVLGHASILAREAGIPCVVDVAEARARLARARRVVVDGDGGTVVVG